MRSYEAPGWGGLSTSPEAASDGKEVCIGGFFPSKDRMPRNNFGFFGDASSSIETGRSFWC